MRQWESFASQKQATRWVVVLLGELYKLSVKWGCLTAILERGELRADGTEHAETFAAAAS